MGDRRNMTLLHKKKIKAVGFRVGCLGQLNGVE